jgi:hypothetical protein
MYRAFRAFGDSPAANLRRLHRRLAGLRPVAKRAYRNGIVKNQQGSDSEVLQIGRRENIARLNLTQSRE